MIGGSQDNDVSAQVLPGSLPWKRVLPGDGTIVDVDASGPAPISYASIQRLGAFARVTIDGIDNDDNGLIDLDDPGESHLIQLLVDGTDGASLHELDSAIQFVQPWIRTVVSPERLVIGTDILYESVDRGDTLRRGDGVDNDGDGVTDEADEVNATRSFGQVTAMAYGGRSGGVANPDVAWIAAGAELSLRTTAAGAFNRLLAYPGGPIRDIALDPDDWHTAYVADQDDVFVTFDAGESWTTLTGNLGSLSQDLRTIVVIGGSAGLEDNVVLVGGTFGRGAWTLPHAGATTALAAPSAVETFPPRIVHTVVTSFDAVTTMVRAAFSEPMDVGTLTTANLFLLDPSDVRIEPAATSVGARDTVIEWTYRGLAPGPYRFMIAADLVTDLDGVALGEHDLLVITV